MSEMLALKGTPTVFGVRWKVVFRATPLLRCTGRKAAPPPAAAGSPHSKQKDTLLLGLHSRGTYEILPFIANEEYVVHFTLCDYMMEIVQNAVESHAKTIRVRCDQSPEKCLFSVEDNGCGMTSVQLQAFQNPFSTHSKKHPGRKMGLGVPLLVHCLTTAGGRWQVDSEPGRGTRIEAEFALSHLDTPPLGDLVDLWVSTLTLAGDYEMSIERIFHDTATSALRGYTLSRLEVRDVLGDLNTATSLTALRNFISGFEAELPLLME